MVAVMIVLSGDHWLKLATLAREIIAAGMSYLTTEALIRNMVLPWRLTRSKWEGPIGGRRKPASQDPWCWNPSWLRGVCYQEGPWARPNMGLARWLARDNPDTNPITRKPETASHLVPLPCCSPPRCPFPIKYFALSACVSPWTIHFRMLDKSAFSGPGWGLISYNSPTSYPS